MDRSVSSDDAAMRSMRDSATATSMRCRSSLSLRLLHMTKTSVTTFPTTAIKKLGEGGTILFYRWIKSQEAVVESTFVSACTPVGARTKLMARTHAIYLHIFSYDYEAASLYRSIASASASASPGAILLQVYSSNLTIRTHKIFESYTYIPCSPPNSGHVAVCLRQGIHRLSNLLGDFHGARVLEVQVKQLDGAVGRRQVAVLERVRLNLFGDEWREPRVDRRIVADRVDGTADLTL